jgi:hypothetical protein
MHTSKLHPELELSAALYGALARKDAARIESLCGELFEFDPKSLTDGLDEEGLFVRRQVHEALDAALRGFILAEGADCDIWRRLLLPADVGVFTSGLWSANARWLRTTGSALPDTNDEVLEAEQLERLDLAEQARSLGRYCVVNDGSRAIAVGAVFDVLEKPLWPFLSSWLVTTYSCSPGRFTSHEAAVHQRTGLDEWLSRAECSGVQRAASPLEMESAYDAAYRADLDAKRIAVAVQGKAMAALFARLATLAPRDDALFAALPKGTRLLVAPNWREGHVSHRCLAPLLEGQRDLGTTALVIRERGSKERGPTASGWRNIEFELPGGTHQLIELGTLAAALSARQAEFAFFPEITPSNSSAWLAMQRLARVQATGYGYPATSGLESVDYFVAGAEVEPAGCEDAYSEQVVLIPGLGVSCSEPPAPRNPRTRPLDDPLLRVVSAAGIRKLGPDLLSAWNAVLGGCPSGTLDIFPAMSVRAAELHLPHLAKHLPHPQVSLHPSVDRNHLIDQLADADLYLDSYPFGGFNTLIEVVASGCPFVTLEDGQARNRFGAAILRRLGLPDFLICHSWPEYIAAATRILTDPGLRLDLRDRLADRKAVLEALADPHASAHFDAAVLWMLQQGPRTTPQPAAAVQL